MSNEPRLEIIRLAAGLSGREAGRFYSFFSEAESSLAIASVSIVEPSN